MANVYGMTGGVSDPYTGSHNIRPTTTDIKLNTEGKILENDLTIQGGGQLYGSAIKYGLSIFGTAGTGVYVNFHGGIGTAFRNGVGGLGDVVNEISDTDEKYVRQIGEMEFIENKYDSTISMQAYESLVFRSSSNQDVYATIMYSTSVGLIVTFYNKLNKIYDKTLTDIGAASSGDPHCAVSTSSDTLFIVYPVYEENPTGSSERYRTYIRYFTTTSYGISRTVYGDASPSHLYVTDDYVMFMSWDRTTGDASDIDIRIYRHNLESVVAKTIQRPNEYFHNYINYCRTSYGLDGRLYVYTNEIPILTAGQADNIMCYIPASGQLVFSKLVSISDFAFLNDPGTGIGYTLVLLFCDGANGHIYCYYSNNSVNVLNNNTETYCAIFNFNMSTKVKEFKVLPQTYSWGLANKDSDWFELDPNFSYDKDTMTINYWGSQQCARMGLNGTNYAVGWTADNYTLVPCELGGLQVDYCYNSNAFEDTSVTTVKTITTDTYTATIEEV